MPGKHKPVTNIGWNKATVSFVDDIKDAVFLTLKTPRGRRYRIPIDKKDFNWMIEGITEGFIQLEKANKKRR